MTEDQGASMSNIGSYNFVVKEHHLDTYGHINNATYLALYEEARWEVMTQKGYSFADIHRSKQGPIILEVNIKFLKEIGLRENITITTELVNYKGKVGQMLQKMIKTDGGVASEALFTFGLFDLKERKLIEPTDKWKHVLGMS